MRFARSLQAITRSLPAVRTASAPSETSLDERVFEKCTDDQLVDIENPYQREKPICFLCRYKIDLDYKNARLLSQFLSSFSGRFYDKHITGLCEHQQRRLRAAVLLSRKAGYLPVFNKEPRFLRDPRLFDPMKPSRPHPY
ncbi:unnamed protein product [Soboliphyme baturini]|uniref:28S ribosomal protein S18c, mitochondrial n=1 Tax=Soboliphyme baturini TaxID=241478 RepID=A0A183JAM1_9BILA|nr:unnamed protein product [Soboliphyme baturini]